MRKFNFSIQRFAESVTLSAGNDTYQNYSQNVIVYAGEGNNLVWNYGNRSSVISDQL